MPIDLSGRVTITLVADDPVSGYVRRQFAPFTEVAGAAEGAAGAGAAGPGIRFEPVVDAVAAPVELQGPAEDGLTTGLDERGAFVRHDGRRCWIPDVLAGETTFGYEPGYPAWRILRSAIRPAVQLAPAAAGAAVAIHAASVTLDGEAILVAGWAESGKTEVALALMERGAAFLSDKWTFVGRADREASAFPIGVGVRRWVLPYLPTLDASITARSRVQFAGAAAAEVVLRPIGRRRARSRTGAVVPDLARRVAALGDRAGWDMDELRAAYGQADDPLRRAPVRRLVLLRTIEEDAVRVRPLEPALAARRLARTAAYERRGYLGLLDRFAYLDPSRPAGSMARAVDADEAVLRDVGSAVPVLLVEAPFPTDPGRIADAILDAGG